jgi:hypothetical protein
MPLATTATLSKQAEDPSYREWKIASDLLKSLDAQYPFPGKDFLGVPTVSANAVEPTYYLSVDARNANFPKPAASPGWPASLQRRRQRRSSRTKMAGIQGRQRRQLPATFTQINA